MRKINGRYFIDSRNTNQVTQDVIDKTPQLIELDPETKKIRKITRTCDTQFGLDNPLYKGDNSKSVFYSRVEPKSGIVIKEGEYLNWVDYGEDAVGIREYNGSLQFADTGTGNDWIDFEQAASDGTYIVASADPLLPNARILSDDAGIAIVDGGAGKTIAVKMDVDSLTALGASALATDYVPIYDVATSTTKKVLISNLPFSSGDITGVSVAGTGLSGGGDTGDVTITITPDTVAGAFSSGAVANSAVNGLATVATTGDGSDLNNDENWIDSSEAPVQSVNGDTGTVSLAYSDLTSGAPAATVGTAGIAELATNVEAAGGIATGVILRPSNLSSITLSTLSNDLANLTIGNGIALGSGTTYNGSAAKTLSVDLNGGTLSSGASGIAVVRTPNAISGDAANGFTGDWSFDGSSATSVTVDFGGASAGTFANATVTINSDGQVTDCAAGTATGIETTRIAGYPISEYGVSDVNDAGTHNFEFRTTTGSTKCAFDVNQGTNFSIENTSQAYILVNKPGTYTVSFLCSVAPLGGSGTTWEGYLQMAKNDDEGAGVVTLVTQSPSIILTKGVTQEIALHSTVTFSAPGGTKKLMFKSVTVTGGGNTLTTMSTVNSLNIFLDKIA